MNEVLGTGTVCAAARLRPDARTTAATGAGSIALYATDWADPDEALLSRVKELRQFGALGVGRLVMSRAR